MKTSYTATLTDGKVITRKSERTYTHYWRVIGIGETKGFAYRNGGFAGSLDLARKSKSSAEAYCRNNGGADVVITSDLVDAITP
jgi:hypothetical protein